MSKYLKTILIILGILVIVGVLVFSNTETSVVEVVDQEKQSEYFRVKKGNFEIISQKEFEGARSLEFNSLESMLDDSVPFDDSIETHEFLDYHGFSEELDSFVFLDGHVAAYSFYKRGTGEQIALVYGFSVFVSEDNNVIISYDESGGIGLYQSMFRVAKKNEDIYDSVSEVDSGRIDGWDVKELKTLNGEVYAHLSVRLADFNGNDIEITGTEDVYIKI